MFIQKGSLNLRVEGAPTVSVTVKTLNPTKVSILNPPHATIPTLVIPLLLTTTAGRRRFYFPHLPVCCKETASRFELSGARLPQNRRWSMTTQYRVFEDTGS